MTASCLLYWLELTCCSVKNYSQLNSSTKLKFNREYLTSMTFNKEWMTYLTKWIVINTADRVDRGFFLSLSLFTVTLPLWFFVLDLNVFGKNMQHSHEAGTFDQELQWQSTLLIVELSSLFTHLSAGWRSKIFCSHFLLPPSASYGKCIYSGFQCSKFLICTCFAMIPP